MKKAIAVFDIGKTNKKFLLFGENYEILFETETQFPEIEDDDGFPCDNINEIENWMYGILKIIFEENEYEILALNFSTYGATIAYMNNDGERCAPVYNYLKPMPEEIKNKFMKEYNSDGDFFRKTASPDLGMLNSGLQIYWLKYRKPELFKKVKYFVHLPHYFSFLLSNKIASEHTSIGCHTGMWDYDNFCYHPWIEKEGISLPDPLPAKSLIETTFLYKPLSIGLGIHDSSASLVPYLKTGKEFILISSGTWCINMNPFNSEPLTKEELDKDCLCYMSANCKQVKSSRLFMGHYHDVNLKCIEEYFNAPKDLYKQVKPDSAKLLLWLKEKKKVFFNAPLSPDGIDNSVNPGRFASFDEAYNRLVFDLTLLEIDALNLVIPKEDKSKDIYISGGFAHNGIFVKLIASYYPDKDVYVSEIPNSSALGAAMITGIFDKEVDLGFSKVEKLV